MAIQGSNFNNFLNGLSKKEKDIYLKNLLTDKMVRARVENKELTVRLNAYDAMWLKM